MIKKSIFLCHPGTVVEIDRMIFPNKANFICPMAQPKKPDATLLEGHGVIPDLEVGLDRKMLLKGIDSQPGSAISCKEKEMQK